MLSSNDALEVSWARVDAWQSLHLDDVKFDLVLCAGGDEDGSYVCSSQVLAWEDQSRADTLQEDLSALVKQGALANSSSISVKIDPAIGGEHPNA